LKIEIGYSKSLEKNLPTKSRL